MSNAAAFIFNESQAGTYAANPAYAKHAVLVWEAADYVLEWGEQRFDGPHMRILEEQPYGAALKEFFDTHVPVPERIDHYVKAGEVRAVRVTEESLLQTVVDGRVEAVATVPAGAYVVRNPGGEMYYNSREEFERRYVPVDSSE